MRFWHGQFIAVRGDIIPEVFGQADFFGDGKLADFFSECCGQGIKIIRNARIAKQLFVKP